MDNKEFLKCTCEVLVEYGFKKIKKNYYLNLDDLIIELLVWKNRFDSSEYEIEFFYSIKALNENPTKIDFEESHLLCSQKLFTDPNPFEYLGVDKYGIPQDRLVRGTCFFNPQKYSKEEWKNIFTEMINRYFNPFKKDAFQAIRDANKERNNNLFFVMEKEVAEYIGAKNY